MASIDESLSRTMKDEEERCKFVTDLDELCRNINTPESSSITDTQKQTIKKNFETLFENYRIIAIQLVYILLSCLRLKNEYVETQSSVAAQRVEEYSKKVTELEMKQKCYLTLVDELNSYKKANQALRERLAGKEGATSSPKDADNTTQKPHTSLSRTSSSPHSSWEKISRSSRTSSFDGHEHQAKMELNEQHSKLLEQVEACNSEYLVKIKTLCQAMCHENAELKKSKEKAEQQAQSEIASLQSKIKELETIGTQTSLDEEYTQLPSVSGPPTTEDELQNTENKANQMKLTAYKQRIDSLEYKVKELTEANSSWVTYREKVKARHSEEIATVKDAYDEVREELKNSKSSIEKMAEEFKKERAIRKQTEEQNTTLRIRVDKAEKTTRELKQENNEKTKLLQRHAEKIKTLEAEREEYVSTYSSHIGSCNSKSRAELIEQVTMYQHTAEVYKSDFLRERGDRERAFSEIADLRVKFREVAQKLGESEKKFDRAKDKFRKLTEENQRLENMLKQREEKYRKLERKYQAAKQSRPHQHVPQAPPEYEYNLTEQPPPSENRLSDMNENNWTCTTCTFLNSEYRIKCELCGTESPEYQAIRQTHGYGQNIEPSDLRIEEYRPRKQQGPPGTPDEL